MKTPNAIICCCAAATVIVSGFQSSVIIRPEARTFSLHSHHQANTNNNDATNLDTNPLDTITSESPKSFGPKRQFLGMRRESGVMRRMMEEQQNGGSRLGSSTALESSPTALMPDGGLSPCVIKVLGVGGGGSNAVSLLRYEDFCCW